jgi:hypothetical protein
VAAGVEEVAAAVVVEVPVAGAVEVEVRVDVVDALADTTPDPSGPAPGIAGIGAAAEFLKVGEEEGADLAEAAWAPVATPTSCLPPSSA